MKKLLYLLLFAALGGGTAPSEAVRRGVVTSEEEQKSFDRWVTQPSFSITLFLKAKSSFFEERGRPHPFKDKQALAFHLLRYLPKTQSAGAYIRDYQRVPTALMLQFKRGKAIVYLGKMLAEQGFVPVLSADSLSRRYAPDWCAAYFEAGGDATITQYRDMMKAHLREVVSWALPQVSEEEKNILHDLQAVRRHAAIYLAVLACDFHEQGLYGPAETPPYAEAWRMVEEAGRRLSRSKLLPLIQLDCLHHGYLPEEGMSFVAIRTLVQRLQSEVEAQVEVATSPSALLKLLTIPQLPGSEQAESPLSAGSPIISPKRAALGQWARTRISEEEAVAPVVLFEDDEEEAPQDSDNHPRVKRSKVSEEEDDDDAEEPDIETICQEIFEKTKDKTLDRKSVFQEFGARYNKTSTVLCSIFYHWLSRQPAGVKEQHYKRDPKTCLPQRASEDEIARIVDLVKYTMAEEHLSRHAAINRLAERGQLPHGRSTVNRWVRESEAGPGD